MAFIDPDGGLGGSTQHVNLSIRRGTSACWLVFGHAIYAKSTHRRLPLRPAGVSVSVPRAARGTNKPNRKSLLLTDSRLRSHPERSSVCWDQTARVSRRL